MVRPEVEIDRFAVGRQTVVFHFDLLFGNRDERIGIVVVAGVKRGPDSSNRADDARIIMYLKSIVILILS